MFKIIFIERRTAGFTSGKLLSDKYQAFWSLKAYSQDVKRHGFSGLAASAVYRIATSTTLLGKQLEPGWIGIPQDKDVIFASCMLTKHMAIMHTNAYEVKYNFNFILKNDCFLQVLFSIIYE